MPDSSTVTLEPLLVSDSDAAAMLGIGKTLLREMDQTGELGPIPVTIRRRRLHVVQHLREWVAMGCPSRPVWLARHMPTSKIGPDVAIRQPRAAQTKDYESLRDRGNTA